MMIRKEALSEDDPLWSELHQVATRACPSMTSRLRELIGAEPSRIDMQTVILIKCGLSPSQTAHLVTRPQEVLTSRRRRLCHKILGDGVETHALDSVIRLL